MHQIILAALGQLLALGRALLPFSKRLLDERAAAHSGVGPDLDLVAIELHTTLDRLADIDHHDVWWRGLLGRAGHHFIAPDYLNIPDIKKWLQNATVGDDLVLLARGRILSDRTPDDPDALARLTESYERCTGEAPYLAARSIEAILGILTAGYAAGIVSGDSQVALAGLLQQSHSTLAFRLRSIEESLNSLEHEQNNAHAVRYWRTELARFKRLIADGDLRPLKRDAEELLTSIKQTTTGEQRESRGWHPDELAEADEIWIHTWVELWDAIGNIVLTEELNQAVLKYLPHAEMIARRSANPRWSALVNYTRADLFFCRHRHGPAFRTALLAIPGLNDPTHFTYKALAQRLLIGCGLEEDPSNLDQYIHAGRNLALFPAEDPRGRIRLHQIIARADIAKGNYQTALAQLASIRDEAAGVDPSGYVMILRDMLIAMRELAGGTESAHFREVKLEAVARAESAGWGRKVEQLQSIGRHKELYLPE